ncbi:hypothetical protein SAMN02745135_02490 [Caloranaerobacter azorensis DSM 13643]|uniref:UPF0182 protein SAMN02745135_02490 n=1 Tax=Caloranaerobacter azorensis DSM 13643 TaxID=1121264 RepID=A0A1M5WIY5_9FIRM|nr:UPF0182 family protein [Caloranaerobacter azorensis]SHH87163.1 hypothetical protein SAMN02745135_02490 [Caloranaerobacter azorensis DSM 13643]
MNKKTGYIIGIVIILALILISSFSSIISFITDYLWFKELGYTKTFFTKLKTQFTIGIPTFILLTLLLVFYFKSIKKSYYKVAGIIPDRVAEKRLNSVLWAVSVLVSLYISSIFAGNLWFTILKFINSNNFNINDPIFNKDISFYIFKLPLLSEIINLLLLLLFILIVLTIVFYLILLAIRRPEIYDGYEFYDGPVRNLNSLFNKRIFKVILFQIGLIGLVIFIIFGLSYILKSYEILYSTRGKVYGASFTDVHISLWVYRIMAFISVISAIGFLIGTIKRKVKFALTGPAALIIFSMLGSIVSGLFQQFIVEPNEISKEQKYLKYNIEYTQKAYGLDNVKEMNFNVEQNLTRDDLIKNKETIKNIKINDYRPVNQVYNQLQGIRQYYRFNDIDIDRYYINGEYIQVFLAARELDQERLSEQAKTWINQHLKYTHGYGLTLSPVNSVTPEGQPELLIKDIPPVTETDLKIKRPEIYFGELTNDYIVVNTDEKEFDYPIGENNQEAVYQGSAGIKLTGINRLLFAIREGSLKLILSGDINSDSRIVINRNIIDRVEKIAPFIIYDDDPYLVINQEDGRLYWIIDGYTVSSKYPYSQPYRNTDINYIRNSVKVVVDAYNGTTKYYVFDEEDPIIMTYKNIFSDLFLDKSQMPKGLREHVRYPQLLFDIQSEVYKVYHINNPVVFYNKEDVWDIAKEKYMSKVQKAESNYVMFKLPDEEKAEFLLTVPYTPATKPNMTALFVARNDGENYGKLFIYKFPKSKTVDGLMMIESRIDQDSNISPQLTLWSQKGSIVLRGNLLVIPIEKSLLYVEPIYLQADNENSLPEVKRVIVAYKNKIVMEETLDKALTKIFGQIDREKDENGMIDNVDVNISDGNLKEIIKRANEIFNKAKEASQKGDWAKYGEYLNKLENILNSLNNSLNDKSVNQ